MEARSRFERQLNRYRAELGTNPTSALVQRYTQPEVAPTQKPQEDSPSLLSELKKLRQEVSSLRETREKDRELIETLRREVEMERNKRMQAEWELEQRKGPVKDLAQSVIWLRTQVDRGLDHARNGKKPTMRRSTSEVC